MQVTFIFRPKPSFDLIDFLVISTQVKFFISATNKNLISAFQGAELLKQAWTSTYKSYVITKRRLKTIAMNGESAV